MAIETMNPANGEILERFDELSPDEVDRRLDRANRAFPDWRDTSFEERSGLMQRAAGLLRDRCRTWAETISIEMGKPITQAVAEVRKCALLCDYYADQARGFLSVRDVPTDAQESFVQYDPIGIVLGIMPWNFPFWQVFRFAVPALMAGNVGVLKHASNVPRSALTIEAIFREAGFPEGAFTTLLLSGGSTESVIRDPRVRAVTLTGSELSGRRVAAIAGEVIKKTVLELGGSDPFIVLEDADIARAAQTAALARMQNTGQSCIAAKRFIVVSDVADRFVERFRAEIQVMKIGDPMSEDTDIGPMARADLREDLHQQVCHTIEQGGDLLLGGEIPEGPGFFYPATLIKDVRPHMSAAREEIFGPVAPVIVVKDEEEAVAVANDSPYGLGASIWTGDPGRGRDLARRIEAGSVFINGLVKSDPRLPFGGVKLSGYGRELSEEGIREFVNIKTVWIRG